LSNIFKKSKLSFLSWFHISFMSMCFSCVDFIVPKARKYIHIFKILLSSMLIFLSVFTKLFIALMQWTLSRCYFL
jgi:hypothetical protein